METVAYTSLPPAGSLEDNTSSSGASQLAGDFADVASGASIQPLGQDDDKHSDSQSDVNSGVEQENDDGDARSVAISDADDDESISAESKVMKREAIDMMKDIEDKFLKLREALISEKWSQYQLELMKLANGTHPELIARGNEAEARFKERCKLAETWHMKVCDTIQLEAEHDRRRINQEYVTAHAALRVEVTRGVRIKKLMLERERFKPNKKQFQSESWLRNLDTLSRKRKLRKQMAESARMHCDMGIYPSYQTQGLSADDVSQDLQQLGIAKMERRVAHHHPLIYVESGRLFHHGHIFSVGDHVLLHGRNRADASGRISNIEPLSIMLENDHGVHTVDVRDLQDGVDELEPRPSQPPPPPDQHGRVLHDGYSDSRFP